MKRNGRFRTTPRMSLNSHLVVYNWLMQRRLWHSIETKRSLLSTGSTQEDPSRHSWKIVDWDVKNQIKQKKQKKNKNARVQSARINPKFIETLHAEIIFQNIFFFENFFHKYHQRVKQFGSGSGLTFCRSWSGPKLFAKDISWHRQQEVVIVGVVLRKGGFEWWLTGFMVTYICHKLFSVCCDDCWCNMSFCGIS